MHVFQFRALAGYMLSSELGAGWEPSAASAAAATSPRFPGLPELLRLCTGGGFWIPLPPLLSAVVAGVEADALVYPDRVVVMVAVDAVPAGTPVTTTEPLLLSIVAVPTVAVPVHV